jgi:EAL and modified HD-GYP domain-containing signal transduction protein
MSQKFPHTIREETTTKKPVSPSAAPGPHESALGIMRDVFVSRQPIYDVQLDVFAYELLFQRGEEHLVESEEPNQATSQGFPQTLLDLDLDTLVGHRRAFLNLTPLMQAFLFMGYAPAFPPRQVVLEFVLNQTRGDKELLDMIRTLSAWDYTIALGGNLIGHGNLQSLVELADIIKIDMHASDRTLLREYVAIFRDHEVALVAEKVETHEDFQVCKDLGFDYFQGAFLYQPELVTSRRAPINRAALLQLLTRLHDPGVEFQELETLISRDVALSYKLLRVINSAYYGLPLKVTTIRQALLFLGIRFVTSCVSLMLLTGIDDKPPELVTVAMVRAKMCEQLARAIAHGSPGTFFLVGLFSVLDALMDRPMSELLGTLPLTEDIAQALLHHEGVLGTTLHCVLAYERGQWEEVTGLGLDHEVMVDAT